MTISQRIRKAALGPDPGFGCGPHEWVGYDLAETLRRSGLMTSADWMEFAYTWEHNQRAYLLILAEALE
jgi:hypothetical protein